VDSDVFVHRSQLLGSDDVDEGSRGASLLAGVPVEFDLSVQEDGKPCAVQVRQETDLNVLCRVGSANGPSARSVEKAGIDLKADGGHSVTGTFAGLVAGRHGMGGAEYVGLHLAKDVASSFQGRELGGERGAKESKLVCVGDHKCAAYVRWLDGLGRHGFVQYARPLDSARAEAEPELSALVALSRDERSFIGLGKTFFREGIREHAMGSIMNGMSLSKLRPFGSTFLVFSDYMKPPIRMAAIMEVNSIFVFTHDSIGVGEDGPTHQPVEQLGALRGIPGMMVFRPCDANESLEMWKHIMPLKDEPVAVILSRQTLPTLDRAKYGPAEGLHKGGYILMDSNCGNGDLPQVILMATGSEVALMLEAHDVLASQGIKVRSVSIPCIELFKSQSEEYLLSVLPNACRARVSIEASRRDSWGAFLGLDGEHVGMITFGASAPLSSLQEKLGFTCGEVVAAAKRVIDGKPRSIASRAGVLKAWKRRKVTE
ncbi:unnamed protein product, partial [Polarella glacialis]